MPITYFAVSIDTDRITPERMETAIRHGLNQPVPFQPEIEVKVTPVELLDLESGLDRYGLDTLRHADRSTGNH
jgi:hypothetical protein